MGGTRSTRNIIIVLAIMSIAAILMTIFGQNAGTPVEDGDYYNRPVPMLIEFIKSYSQTSDDQVQNSVMLRENLYGSIVVRFVDIEKDAELLKEYEEKYGKISSVPYHILTDKDRKLIVAKEGYMTYLELMNMIAENITQTQNETDAE